MGADRSAFLFCVADSRVLRARLHWRTPQNETLLLEPLADPLQDIRVNHSTAEAYVVRCGEYIQVIDVAGRQCTDFQCFAARKLDRGVDHPLDVTTTRSLIGQSYPTIALARVDVTTSEIGTEVEVGKLDGHQKRLPTRVVRFPHYDPEKTRVRA
jgi:uncharacterized protein YcgI (DUF1989 family)